MARELAIHVTAETQQAEVNLQRVEQGLQGIEQKAEGGAKSSEEYTKLADRLRGAGKEAGQTSSLMGELNAAVVRYAGPAALGLAVRQTLQFADNISDLSRRTGVGTTALQQFGAVARMGGSSMDAVALAVQRLGERLSSGDRSAVASIRALGLNTEELLAMNPETRFRTWAEAIARVQDPAKQAELAMDGIGRSGLTLINVLKDIGEGADQNIPAMSEAMIRVGGVMQDQFDLMTESARTFFGALLLGWPAAMQVMQEGIQEWMHAAHLVTFGSNARGAVQAEFANPATPGAPAMFQPRTAGGIAGFDPLGGNSMAFIERDLTRATEDLIRARTRASSRTAEATETNAMVEALLRRSDENLWSVGARGPNVSGAFPWTVSPFPGWATPDPIATTGWQPPWAQYPGAIQPNRPNLPGPGLFQRMLGNPLAQFGMSQAFSLVPGLSGMGSSMGGGFGSALGQMGGVSQALGGFASFLGPIGGLVGGLLGRLFGPSQATQTRRARGSFIEDFGGMEQLREAADHAGFSLDRLLNVRKVKDFEAEVRKLNQALQLQEVRDALKEVQDAFVDAAGGMDHLRAQAEVLGFNLDHAFAADNAEDFSERMREFEERLEETNQSFNPLLAKADELGIRLPAAIEASLRQLREMGLLMGDNVALADRLLGRTDAVDWRVMGDIAERLGIPTNALGGAFNTGRIGAGAGSIVNDLDTLRRGGADIGGILNTSGVQELFQNLGRDSISNNVALPENLRQYFEELARVGQLGNVDPFMLQFGPAIQTEFEQNTNAINNLIATLGSGPMVEALTGGPLVQALNNFPRDFQVNVNVTGAGSVSGGGGGGTPGYVEGGTGAPINEGDLTVTNPIIDELPIAVNRGGIILGRGRVQYFGRGGRVRGDFSGFEPIDWRVQGPDTVPAMLTPGEMVLTPGQAAAIGQALEPRGPQLVDSLPSFSDGGDKSINIIVLPDVRRDEEIVDRTFRDLPRRIQTGEVNKALRKAVEMRRRKTRSR